MHQHGVFRRFLGCGAGEDEAMTRWGEIKCPRCEELEAKLAAEQERCAKVAQRCADLADTNGDYLLICDVVAAIREGGK
jgi:phage FluMu protein Com